MKKIISFFVFLILILVSSHELFAQDEKWNQHKSPHFVIYYKDIPLDFIKTVVTAAEEQYEQSAEGFGFRRVERWNFDSRAKIYIYDDSQDYIANSLQQQWSHGAAFAAQRTIRTFPSAHGFFDSTLPHEMGHIIFREFIGLKPDVPLWFEEGVAMYQEKAQRYGANAIVQKALEKGEFIPLKELTDMRLYNGSPQWQIELFYAESASIVNFIINELGEHKFVRFCRALKEGRTFTQALQDVYVRFKNLDDLNRAWLNYLEKQ